MTVINERRLFYQRNGSRDERGVILLFMFPVNSFQMAKLVVRGYFRERRS